jgi:uncharacterized protein (DUF924 family)
MTEPWVGEVLAFWFETLDQKGRFAKNEAVDAKVTERFLPVHVRLSSSLDIGEALSSPEQALASVIALDQFPRNMFRGSPRAFAVDPLAVGLAKEAVGRGIDARIAPIERRVFIYLPFEHSESLADQDRSVELMRTLGNPEFDRYAEAHRVIIERFGRFPHRNAVLGRVSTPEEIEFLKGPNSGF